MLWNKPIHKDTMFEDKSGKRLPALKVLSLAIRYMSTDVVSIMKSQSSKLTPQDINWVLTIPALCDDSAKLFMSLAAQEGGLLMKNCAILLTSAAATIYCRYVIPKGYTLTGGTTYRAGQKYIVLEADTEETYINLHEMYSENKLQELYKATDGTCLWTMVENSFLDFLADLIGKEAIHHFKDIEREDYMELLHDFEIKSTAVDLNTLATVRLPIALIDQVNDEKGQSMKDIISKSQHAKHVKLNGEKLRLDGSLFRSIFKQSIDKIKNILSAVLRTPEARGCETILGVGRYFECSIPMEAVRKEFSGMNIIVPAEAELAAVRGAVLFGHRPLEVVDLKKPDVSNVPDLDSLASDDASSYDHGDSSTIEAELKEMNDLLKCKRCKQRRVALTFLPCGHCITCEKCGLEVRSCPMCPAAGSNVQGTIKTLFTSNSVSFGS
ncbi:heat shock 70 kDa protein 12A-like [Dreissena polymorpha]|uniref:RING-type domain-containing protein n=1 Tax=Dreissena polymorpha TaxID=45954 RepID=A0A9D4HVJ2_DREPO|nr:heat shock 70 kDa protein 12A-like [Dreissena polymorpha]KAH3734527.1 hypothetical protein DPMN_040966 [Dreissena polymorpha]